MISDKHIINEFTETCWTGKDGRAVPGVSLIVNPRPHSNEDYSFEVVITLDELRTLVEMVEAEI
jgi:hypothetical protein